jgi:ligand-binding sensor domain-containing protein
VESRVVRFDPGTGAAQRFGEFDGPPYSLLIDSSSHLWVVRAYALFRGSTQLPFGGFEQVRPPGSTSKTVFTRAVEDSRGDLWFGSYSGLFRLSGGKWLHYQQTDGLAANRISTLATSPDGDVLAMYTGDSRIDRIHSEGERVRVEQVDRSHGLEPDRVHGVRFDRQGRMWARTDHGAALREGGKCVHFDRSDGLISDGCSAFLGAADGSVWIGTGRGLSHMLHPRVPAVRAAPSVTFSEVRLGNRVVDASGLLVEQQPEPLTVKLSTLNLARGSRIQYRYRCIGLNERWSEAARPEVSLDYPRAGRYRLEVQARWPDAPWGPAAALAVEVRARWFNRGGSSPCWPHWPVGRHGLRGNCVSGTMPPPGRGWNSKFASAPRS